MDYVPAVEIAQDIVQDFFLNYWERRHQGVEAPDNFGGYARRAVRNLSIDHVRRQQVNERRQSGLSFEEEALESYGESGDADHYHQRLQRIFELIDQLPPGQRAILKMHALEKLSYAQIAERQGVSVNTVRTQLTRAYRTLRQSASGLLIFSLLKYL